MDERTHYNELLVRLRTILDKYEQYKDDPNVIIAKMGMKLEPLEEPKDRFAYSELIREIVDLHKMTER